METCTLGCGEYRVVFGDRCGTHILCSMDNDINSLEFGRVLDETSEAVVGITIPGSSDGSTCCECVGSIRTWAHSISVYRDGALVWGPGPVTNTLMNMNKATIKAQDISAWLNRRVIREKMVFTKVDIVEIAVAIIRHALLPDDPCNIFDLMNVTYGGVKIDKTIEANKSYAGDVLRDLAKIGLDFTVVGATIILAPNIEFGPIATLQDEDFLAEIEVEERGEETATKWYVNGKSVTGTSGGTDPVYGLIEQISGESENVEDLDAANEEAKNRLIASNPSPMYVNIPDGSTLSPNAPVCFDHLVPGSLVNVDLRGLCKPFAFQNRLTAVRVSVDSNGEAVQVTLSPRGTTQDEAQDGGDA